MRVFELLLETTVAHEVLFVCNELRGFDFPIWSHSVLVIPSVFDPVGNELGT